MFSFSALDLNTQPICGLYFDDVLHSSSSWGCLVVPLGRMYSSNSLSPSKTQLSLPFLSPCYFIIKRCALTAFSSNKTCDVLCQCKHHSLQKEWKSPVLYSITSLTWNTAITRSGAVHQHRTSAGHEASSSFPWRLWKSRSLEMCTIWDMNITERLGCIFILIDQWWNKTVSIKLKKDDVLVKFRNVLYVSANSFWNCSNEFH